ncbi:MAG: M48 family metalloprotease [Armatimonadetes bacterium]|nr:M48 family metalloprotease [Armatimonadota bacterium]
MRWRWPIWIVLALVGAVAPAQGRIIGRSAEVSLGREIASRIEQMLPVDRDAVATARVQQLGRRLVSVAEDVDLPYEFHVVETSEINAFALPGGFVYVHRGLLQLLPNDDALAFVLGHEITHAARHHSIDQMEKSLAVSLLLGAVSGGSTAAAAQAADLIIGLKFTRDDENEADRIGLRSMARAGFNPNAAAEAMLVIRRAAGKGKDLPPFLRSHPAPDSRIARLNQLATEVRAAEQASRAVPTDVGPPPPPVLPERALAGLEGVRLAECDYFPLVAGGEWHYLVRGQDGEGYTSVRILEVLSGRSTGPDELPSGLPGWARVRLSLGRSVEADWLAAPAGDRVYLRPPAADRWYLHAVFTPDGQKNQTDGFAVAGPEKVRVPAGEFEALRVDRLDAQEGVVSSSWYARGVGLVKRHFSASGITEELERYQFPPLPTTPQTPEPVQGG